VVVWGDYSSVIQLGAGLNFAYASLELLLEKPLSSVETKRLAFLKRVREIVETGQMDGRVMRADDFSRISGDLERISATHKFVCNLNPYAAGISATLMTFILVYGAEHSHETITTIGRVLVVSIGFGWFGGSLSVLTIFRALLGVADARLR
jgi:hypothetical protein